MEKTPLIIAHRGASDECPENTLSSIQRAIDLHVDGIEIDIQMTRDRQLAVFHDSKLGRTCPGTKKIIDTDAEELFSLPANIPSLTDVLKLPRKPFLMIEIKTTVSRAAEMAQLALEQTKDFPHIILASFCAKALETLRHLKCPHPLFGIAETKRQLASFTAVDGYALHYKWHKEKIAQELLKSSQLFFWTVDSIPFAKKLTCHGLITNKPRTLQKALYPEGKAHVGLQKGFLPY